MTKPSASKAAPFVEKLHDTISYESTDLCWDSSDRFRMTGDDQRARRALAEGGFDFKSLSSFVRQLSYYGFKRMSDRRRSKDKMPASQCYIIFGHPSGHFSRDNPKLHLITRKLRARKSTSGRRGSSASTDAGLDRDYEAEDQDQEEEEGAINVQDEPNVVAPEEHRHYAPAFHDHHPLHSASPFSLYPLPARSPHDQWQSPYPSPLHAPFHSPTNGILGLPHPSMLTGLHHSGSYFSPPLASYSPTMMETSRFDGAHGSGMPSSSHCASGMVAPLGIGIGGAPPSPANSTSSSSEVEAQPQPHNPHDMGFASPPHPRAPLLHHELCLTSASEHSSIATSSPDFKPSSANATTDFYSHPSQSFGLLYTTSEAHHA